MCCPGTCLAGWLTAGRHRSFPGSMTTRDSSCRLMWCAGPRLGRLVILWRRPCALGRFGPAKGEVLFDRICRENGIGHILTAPYSPTTTRKVERWHAPGRLNTRYPRDREFDRQISKSEASERAFPQPRGRDEMPLPRRRIPRPHRLRSGTLETSHQRLRHRLRRPALLSHRQTDYK